MRRKILCFMLLIFLFPLAISAENYNVLDAHVSLDENNWRVFTIDNIKDNPELEELGQTYEYMNSLFISNDIYLDAVLFSKENVDDNVELFIIAKPTTIKSNLHKYSDSDMRKIEKEIIKDTVSNSHDIYSTNNYKYVYMYYEDQGLSICDYYTVMNGYVYTIKIQKVNAFTENEKVMIKKIIDSITFEFNKIYEVAPKKNTFSFYRIIIYIIVGGVFGGLSSIIAKKRKSK